MLLVIGDTNMSLTFQFPFGMVYVGCDFVAVANRSRKQTNWQSLALGAKSRPKTSTRTLFPRMMPRTLTKP